MGGFRRSVRIGMLFDEGAEAEIGSGAFAFTMGAWNRLS